MPIDGILGGVKIPFFNRGSSSKKEGALKTPNKAEPRVIQKPTPKASSGAERTGVISVAPKASISTESVKDRYIQFKESLSKKLKLNRDKGNLHIFTYEGSALDNKDNQAIKAGYYAKNVRFIVQIEIPSTTPNTDPHTSELELDFSFKVKADNRDDANTKLREETQKVQKLIANVAQKELKNASAPINLTPLKAKFFEEISYTPNEKATKAEKKFDQLRKTKISANRLTKIQFETKRALQETNIQSELATLNQYNRYLGQTERYTNAQGRIKASKRRGESPEPKDLAVKAPPKMELKLVKNKLAMVDKNKVSSQDRLAVAFHIGSLASTAAELQITDIPSLDQDHGSDSKNQKQHTIGLGTIMESIIPLYSKEAIANPGLGKDLITALTLQYIDPQFTSIFNTKAEEALAHNELFSAFAKLHPDIGSPNDMGKTFNPDTMYSEDLVESRKTFNKHVNEVFSLPNLHNKQSSDLTPQDKRILQLDSSAQQLIRNKIRNTQADLHDPLKFTVGGALAHLKAQNLTDTPEFKNLQNMAKELKNGISTIDINELAQILEKLPPPR